MNEGGLIKTYIDKYKVNKADVARVLDIPEEKMSDLYESQTVEPDVKEKLKSYFKQNIFNGTLLEEISKPGQVPDQSETKSKSTD